MEALELLRDELCSMDPKEVLNAEKLISLIDRVEDRKDSNDRASGGYC